ncbi:MAG: aliphatic sulfonate ABC transporter substrate-binding protein [Tildeniella nuda ZEHNDER 1965/U140]|nr:aliphatic sulfonate ABC transporter substrate-binding protein [Tildeniella nuda ZEHNDER 1965/U140]
MLNLNALNLKANVAAWKRPNVTRRSALFFLGCSLVFSTTLASCGGSSTNSTQPSAASPSASPISSTSSNGKKLFRVVRSKQLTALAVLEKQGTLEKALEPLGYTVQWLEFAAGPQQLEAIKVGALDIAQTAESPPVFAQASGTDLVYLATMPRNGKPVALLIANDSSAKSIKDLKGKKIAFQKASIGHYLLVKALEKEGLKLSDVQSVFLPPADASSAFSQGKVDGWFIWDPFITRTEQAKLGRVLLDGETLRDTSNFYSSNRQFAKDNPEALKVFFQELEKAEAWTRDHKAEVSHLLAPVTQLKPEVLDIMHDKYEYGLRSITPAIISKQQEVADLWYDLKLVPVKVDVRKGFLTPEEYAKFTPQNVLAQK